MSEPHGVGKIKNGQWEPLGLRMADANPFGAWAVYKGASMENGQVLLRVYNRHRLFWLYSSYWFWSWKEGHYYFTRLVEFNGWWWGLLSWFWWVITKRVVLRGVD